MDVHTKKYIYKILTHLVCNIFIIAFFQAFLSIGENESFMSADKIDPMI